MSLSLENRKTTQENFEHIASSDLSQNPSRCPPSCTLSFFLDGMTWLQAGKKKDFGNSKVSFHKHSYFFYWLSIRKLFLTTKKK